MFRQLWKTWTIDKPAAFGDLLWEIPVVVLILAYAYRIRFPPEGRPRRRNRLTGRTKSDDDWPVVAGVAWAW